MLSLEKYRSTSIDRNIYYLLVDKLGEWKTRRDHCRLGIAILNSLLVEIQTALNIMNSTYAQTQQAVFFQPPGALLPTKSWSGMQTIPDQVLLRIIAVSEDVAAPSFHPSGIRDVCKDYFDHMCANFNNAIISNMSVEQMRSQFSNLLGEPSKYLATTQQVKEMLEQTKELLDQNSKRWFPK